MTYTLYQNDPPEKWIIPHHSGRKIWPDLDQVLIYARTCNAAVFNGYTEVYDDQNNLIWSGKGK